MADWQSDFIEANGTRLHYTRTGGAKPPILLAHGVTDDGLCWTPVAAALAPDYDVVMVDARGHGHSDPSPDGYALAALAADLAGAITALGLRRPAVLGHSLGAATALVLAATEPDLPRAILLEDPPAWWAGWSTLPGAAERAVEMKTRALDLRGKTSEELIAGQGLLQPGWSAAELAPWAEAKRRFDPKVIEVFDPAFGEAIDWPTLLPRITCPVLLITGDPTAGAIVTTDSAAALQSLVPQLQVAHVPAAGHSIRRDQFASYLDIVRAFLAELRLTT
jgi:pimeloyl-ACP methyl ester carboxylesterase